MESGWDIGSMPKLNQVAMRLATVNIRAVIRKTSMIAHYVDKDGEHETGLGDLKVTPFMAVRSGKHTTHLIYR